jgi:hypothetical protein
MYTKLNENSLIVEEDTMVSATLHGLRIPPHADMKLGWTRRENLHQQWGSADYNCFWSKCPGNSELHSSPTFVFYEH